MPFVRRVKITAEHVAEADEVEAAVLLKEGLEAVAAALASKGFTNVSIVKKPGVSRKAKAPA